MLTDDGNPTFETDLKIINEFQITDTDVVT